MRPETDLLHVAEGLQPDAAPLERPIYTSSTYLFANAAELEAYQQGRSGAYLYSRYANPSVQAVEEKLASLEGAEAAVVTSSGMAATSTALFGLLSTGDELICSSAVYGGTLQVIARHLQRFGVSIRFISLEELAGVDRLIGPATRVVWFESPTNPTLRCPDIAEVAAQCRRRGVLSILDSTFASPINQQPLRLGVDLVMHSATKFLNGHSDVTAGALAGRRETLESLREARKLFGGVLDPMAAYALARGMKTLAVRVARQNASAGRIAEWCERDPRIARVLYPGLASHPDQAVARRQMSGFGGMVTVDLRGGYEAACGTFDRLRVIRRAASLGGVESLCSLPVLTSHYGLTDDQLASGGVTRGMMRLSIGLEHPDDLIADLDQALR